MANLYEAQIREIGQKYENEKDRRCPSFHYYSSD